MAGKGKGTDKEKTSMSQAKTSQGTASGKAVGIVAAVAIVIAVALGSSMLGLDGTDVASSSAASASQVSATTDQSSATTYTFRSKTQLKEHYKKHGKAMGFASAEEYQAGANAVINNPDALHKTQREDGDDVYYLQPTDEFVVVSTDGYIRTYFNPGGINYYNNQ